MKDQFPFTVIITLPARGAKSDSAAIGIKCPVIQECNSLALMEYLKVATQNNSDI